MKKVEHHIVLEEAKQSMDFNNDSEESFDTERLQIRRIPSTSLAIRPAPPLKNSIDKTKITSLQSATEQIMNACSSSNDN